MTLRRVFLASILACSIAGEAAAYSDGPVAAGGNIPLARAVARLVPKDASVTISSDVDQGAFVRWSAGPSWQRSLFDALAANSIGVSFNAEGVVIGGQVGPFEPFVLTAPVLPVPDGGSGQHGDDPGQAPPAIKVPPAMMPTALPLPVGPSPIAEPHSPGAVEAVAATTPGLTPRSLVPPADAVVDAPRPAEPEIQAAAASSPAVAASAEPAPATAPAANTAPPPIAEPVAVYVPMLPTAVVPEPSVPQKQRWAVAGQSTLQLTLQTWAETAGWTLYYETPTQYELPAAAELEGNFEEAASRLIHLLRHRRPVPLLTLHPTNRSLAVRSFASGGVSQ